MAVTKIRKFSSWTLLASMLLTVVVLVMFYTGGVVDPSADNLEPVNTSLMINWTFILFGIVVLATLIFAILQFLGQLKHSPKKALGSLASVIVLVVILLIGYSMADGTPLQNLNADAQKDNIPLWLKMADMWIYSIYAFVVLIIGCIIVGSIKKLLKR